MGSINKNFTIIRESGSGKRKKGGKGLKFKKWGIERKVDLVWERRDFHNVSSELFGLKAKKEWSASIGLSQRKRYTFPFTIPSRR